MKTAFYWSRINGFRKEGFDVLCGYLASEGYSKRKGYGFVLEKASPTEVIATYVERSVVTDSLLEPSGKKILTERVVYEYLPFRLSTGILNVEFIGGARLHSQFFKRIARRFPDYLSEDRISIDVASFISEMSSRFQKLEVVAVRMDGLLLKNRTLCGMDFRSSVDVREDVQTLIGKRKSAIMSYAKIRFKSNDKGAEVELSHAGKLTTSLDRDSNEFAEIRSILSSQVDGKAGE